MVVRSNLRPSQDNLAFRVMAFYLPAQKEASIDVPEVTAHPDEVRLGIHYEFQEGLIASIAHQMAWHQCCLYPHPGSDHFEVGRGKRDIFIAEEKIVGLNGKLEQQDFHF